MEAIKEIANDIGITLNGCNADFYKYGEDRMIIIENHFSESETELLLPNILIVTNQTFKQTILKHKGKF